MGGWMDGSMITSLNRGTSIDAITEISGVQRQFLGIRFCFDDGGGGIKPTRGVHPI